MRFQDKNGVRTTPLCFLLQVLLYCCTKHMVVRVFGAWTGWSVGGWVVWWMGGGCFVRGEYFRACERWGWYCLWYSILFSPLYRLDLAKFEYEPTRLFATAVEYGGWVGWWVDGLVGGRVGRAVRGWCFLGELEPHVVLVW